MAQDMVDQSDVISEVQMRFESCDAFESDWRKNAVADLKFFHADSSNNHQWDSAEYQQRAGSFGGSTRPCLTINKVQAHVRQVENDARQSQMGIKINATGFGASEKAADALEGIIRHIEYQSNAQQNAYACAIQGQVRQGRGWVHIRTDWVRGHDSFDQDFYIESVPDPLSVYSDPNCREPDHSDMQWAMLVSTMPRADFERQYPDHADAQSQALSILPEKDRTGWEDKESVRIARYYRRSEEKDTLWQTPSGPMRESVIRQAQGGPDLVEMLRKSGAQSRPIVQPLVEWFLIAGNTVIDHGPTVFDSIPLVPFIGTESIIEGKFDAYGLVRLIVDPQKMFNYSASAYMEGLGSQTKPQWMASVRSIEGYEEQWAQHNVSNLAFLPYNDIDPDDNTQIAPPTRVEPPQGSPGHMQAMQNADLQMQMVTGQYQAELGAPGNERSGTAINERQRQSDTANYHYTDNQGMALRLVGRTIVHALPKVYDVTRAVQILGVDGQQSSAVIDPQAAQSAQVALPGGQPPPNGMSIEDQMELQGAILAVNPTIGRYDVEADVGPAFATRRQDTFNSIMQVLQSAPQLMGQIGDLFFKAADFPLADEIADRLKPASQDPAAQAAQQQIQALQAQIGQLTQQLKSKGADQQIKAAQLDHDRIVDAMSEDTDRYKAETDRMAAIGSVDPSAFMPLIKQLIQEAMGGQQQGQAPATPPPQSPPDAGSVPAAMPRLPTNNPPGGPIHAAVPVNGDVQ